MRLLRMSRNELEKNWLINTDRRVTEKAVTPVRKFGTWMYFSPVSPSLVKGDAMDDSKLLVIDLAAKKL